MGLDTTDIIPAIDFSSAYAAIRAWYQANSELLRGRMAPCAYVDESEALIHALPESLSDLETKAVFSEIISGLLEWGYHDSDGRYKMAAYAHGALETAGQDYCFEPDELDALSRSGLWRLLTASRYRPTP